MDRSTSDRESFLYIYRLHGPRGFRLRTLKLDVMYCSYTSDVDWMVKKLLAWIDTNISLSQKNLRKKQSSQSSHVPYFSMFIFWWKTRATSIFHTPISERVNLSTNQPERAFDNLNKFNLNQYSGRLLVTFTSNGRQWKRYDIGTFYIITTRIHLWSCTHQIVRPSFTTNRRKIKNFIAYK